MDHSSPYPSPHPTRGTAGPPNDGCVGVLYGTLRHHGRFLSPQAFETFRRVTSAREGGMR